MNKDSFFAKIPTYIVLLCCMVLLFAACGRLHQPDNDPADLKTGDGYSDASAADNSESLEDESTPEFEGPAGIGDEESIADPSGEEPNGTPKISANKVREAEESAVTEPTEEQSRVISVYRQLYPECKDSKPLCDPLYNEGEIFFVPEEWVYAYYPAVTGKAVFYEVGDYNVCAFIQTTGEKGEFRFGLFDGSFKLLSDVFSGTPLFEGKVWPHKIIERGEKKYLAVEYYYGWHGIRSSETVIYALPSMERVWCDTELYPNDPDSEFDSFRFAINGDSFDVYDFVYHNGWMEETFKTSIEISEIDLP